MSGYKLEIAAKELKMFGRQKKSPKIAIYGHERAGNRASGIATNCCPRRRQASILHYSDAVFMHSAATSQSSIQGYTPAQIRAAYNFDQITLSNGAAADGTGRNNCASRRQLYNDPNIVADLVKVFDTQFGLSAPAELEGCESRTAAQRSPQPMPAGQEKSPSMSSGLMPWRLGRTSSWSKRRRLPP